MSDRFTPFAPQGAHPIQTVFCTAGIPQEGMAAPSVFTGECKETMK